MGEIPSAERTDILQMGKISAAEKIIATSEWEVSYLRGIWMDVWMYCSLVAVSDWGIFIYGASGGMLHCKVVLSLPSSSESPSSGCVDGCSVCDRGIAMERCIVVSMKNKRHFILKCSKLKLEGGTSRIFGTREVS